MRYLKILGLAAVAASALMAIAGAGSASATVLCSTTIEPCPAGQSWPVNTVLDFSLGVGNSATFSETIESEEPLEECAASTLKMKITKPGNVNETVTGTIEEFTFGACKDPIKVLSKGNFEIHKIAGTSNGTLTADGPVEVTIGAPIVGSCVYIIQSGKSIGDITEGKPAIIHFNTVLNRIVNPLCPETAKFKGTYTLTSPTNTTLSVGNS
jgi:hypothetical protein